MRDLRRDALNLGQALRIIVEAARGFGKHLERMFGGSGFARLLVVQESDTVNQYLTLPGLAHQLLQRRVASVVVAVGNDEEHLFVFLPVCLGVIDRHANRIAHRGATAGIDFIQHLFQLLNIVRERSVQIRYIIEIDDKDLVLRI